MSSIKQFSRWQIGLITIFFLISRVYVLMNPPYHKVIRDGQIVYEGYSDVQHDSERYANMWYYGLTPYREHLFEYPPAAIPIMLVPLLVDQAGIGYYYQDYRVQIFLFEILLFSAILFTVNKLPIKLEQKWFSVMFYIGAGVIAKDFWYDGLDLVFFGSLTFGLIWRLWHDNRKIGHRIIFWAFFWLSVAVKLLTVPLLLPFYWLKRREWQKELMAVAMGAIVIWIVPLILYRSSLSVFLFFHGTRPLKYEAFGTWIVQLVNDFTHTEIQSQIAPHFPIVGPVSTVVEKSLELIFPLSILMVIGWSMQKARKQNFNEPKDRLQIFHYLIQVTLVYLFTIFLTSKIFSRPFHLWYVPLIAIYPFKNWKVQLIFILGSVSMLIWDTTQIIGDPQILWGLVWLKRIRDFWRFVPMMILLVLSLRLKPPTAKLPEID